MAKTDSRYITILIGGGATPIQCSVNSITGIGLTHSQIDITTLCNEIMENLQGVGSINLTFNGYFDTGASGMYTVIQPLATAGTLTDVTIQIGQNAAPAMGDPQFVITNGLFFNYLPAGSVGSAVTDTVNLVGGEGVTATWGTVP